MCRLAGDSLALINCDHAGTATVFCGAVAVRVAGVGARRPASSDMRQQDSDIAPDDGAATSAVTAFGQQS